MLAHRLLGLLERGDRIFDLAGAQQGQPDIGKGNADLRMRRVEDGDADIERLALRVVGLLVEKLPAIDLAEPVENGGGERRLPEPRFRQDPGAVGEQAGHAVTKDFNGAQQEGMGAYQRTINDGARWSTSYAFLRPILDERKNLTVKSTALVSKVVFRGGHAHGCRRRACARGRVPRARRRRHAVCA